MHHHLVEVRSAKERERRRQTSFPFLCWTTMTFDDDPRDDDDGEQTVFEHYWVNQARKSLLVRSFWSISQRPRPRGEPNRRSNVLKRLILTYLSKHAANIDVHASILYKMSSNTPMQHWRRTISATTCLLRYELKMVSPVHEGSIEICATYEQEIKGCFLGLSVQTTCVEINGFRWATTWNIAARQTFGRQTLEYCAAVYVLQCMCRPFYRDTCSAFLYLLIWFLINQSKPKTKRFARRRFFPLCPIENIYQLRFSMSFGRRKVYWMLDLLYGSPLCSCVRQPWYLVARYLMLQQRIYESRYTMPIRDA